MKKGLFIFILLFGLVGCAANQLSGTTNLQVMDVWGRPLPLAVENGAFYMHIMNGRDTVESELCQDMQIHTVMMNEQGVMHMEEIASGRLDIPAHDTIKLEPGGLHIMCLGKNRALTVGEEVSLTLTFAQSGTMLVTAAIRDEAIAEEIDHTKHKP